MSVSIKKLDFWADNHYNVIFSGRHGVGKTAIIEKVFNEKFGEQGKDWLYFSAATMDPWVNFIGVPKEKYDEQDDISYLELVRPKVFALDQVQAIFFDEYNRSQKTVRNAVMELMQFKSINGHKFHNMKVIWAAINPPDENEDELIYDVEKIDPAQLDRFHIYVELPYGVSKSYFVNKYGDVEGAAACDWWQSLSENQQNVISPRRLDYAISCWSAGGDIKDVLPKGISTSELQKQLKSGSYKVKLKKLLSDDSITDDELKKELTDERFFVAIKDKMITDNNTFLKIFPLLEDEKMVESISQFTPKDIASKLEALGECESVREVLEESLNTNKKFLTAAKRREIQKWLNDNFSTSVEERDLNDHEQYIDDELLGPNSCYTVAERNIENENTYYREKRFNNISIFLGKTKVTNAIKTNEISIEYQQKLFEAIGDMCWRTSRDKIKTIRGFCFPDYKLRPLKALIENLQNSGYDARSAIEQNDSLEMLLADWKPKSGRK